jgi:F420-dependent oxidoreductase-like protein
VGRVVTLRIFTEPQQGASYETLLAHARRTEELGFDAWFRSDHYLAMGGVDGRPGPTDAWTTLAGLARETARVRLGTLVTSATFRHPGPLAVTVAQVDAMSGGRVELGIGAGWFDDEHRAYGIPFPPVEERFDRLEEQLEVITGLWATPEGATYDHPGAVWPVAGSPALPEPVQRPGPPVIVGGRGLRRTPMLAARHAAEFNLPFEAVEALAPAVARVRAACEAIGRDPATMTFSAAQQCVVGADEAEYVRRAAAVGRDPAELRDAGICGTVAEAAAKVRALAEAGAERLYLQVLDLDDHDHLALLAAELQPVALGA